MKKPQRTQRVQLCDREFIDVLGVVALHYVVPQFMADVLFLTNLFSIRFPQIFRKSQEQAKRLLAISTNIIYEEVSCMDLLWTIVVILVILWLLGFGLGFLGSLIHILLVIAIIVILIRIIQGRNPL